MTKTQKQFIKCKANCETCEKCLTYEYLNKSGTFVGCEKYIEFAHTKQQLQEKKTATL